MADGTRRALGSKDIEILKQYTITCKNLFEDCGEKIDHSSIVPYKILSSKTLNLTLDYCTYLKKIKDNNFIFSLNIPTDRDGIFDLIRADQVIDFTDKRHMYRYLLQELTKKSIPNDIINFLFSFTPTQQQHLLAELKKIDFGDCALKAMESKCASQKIEEGFLVKAMHLSPCERYVAIIKYYAVDFYDIKTKKMFNFTFDKVIACAHFNPINSDFYFATFSGFIYRVNCQTGKIIDCNFSNCFPFFCFDHKGSAYFFEKNEIRKYDNKLISSIRKKN